ncbi:DUF4976 domain-containing protein [Puteibacter caeruleilacunae]|nr:DUF4976 domain-containing protein [Puteibacter caeruleilacunae]
MNKSLFLSLGCISILALGCQQKADIPKQPNIVFIMTDDHSIQTLSAYDSRYIQTPNLDRIAKEGVIFQNSFVANSICAPSRAVMLTGKHSHKNGQINNRVTFDGSQQTFPKLLRAAGYQTALIGKWHLKSNPTGFDYWNILPGQGQYYNPDFIEMGEQKRFEGYATTLTTDFAINWLDQQRDKTKPFCLLVHHKAPHRTWMPDTADLDLYADKTFTIPDNFYDDYEGRTAAKEQHMSIHTGDMDLAYDLKMVDDDITTARPGLGLGKTARNMLKRMNDKQRAAWNKHYNPIIQDFKDRNPKGKELSEWKFQRYMRDYLSCVKSVDDNVGRLLDYLDNQQLSENTIIVYTSDQGFYMGEHGWFDKRFMYEESLRTPLLMKLPKGYTKKGAITQLVQNIDYAPTFLDLAGVDIPGDIQGESLKPLLFKDPVDSWRNSIYYHYYEYPGGHMVKRHYGIRTDRYKLIHFYNDIDQWEFYDLEEDPTEMNNLINSTKHQNIITTLKEQLHKLQIKYDDLDKTIY